MISPPSLEKAFSRPPQKRGSYVLYLLSAHPSEIWGGESDSTVSPPPPPIFSTNGCAFSPPVPTFRVCLAGEGGKEIFPFIRLSAKISSEATHISPLFIDILFARSHIERRGHKGPLSSAPSPTFHPHPRAKKKEERRKVTEGRRDRSLPVRSQEPPPALWSPLYSTLQYV